MKRREFFRSGLAAAGLAALPWRRRPANAAEGADTNGWREFEIVTSIEVLDPAGRTRVWLPVPLSETDYQHTLGDTYRADSGFVEMYERPNDSTDMLVAEWPDGIAPILHVTSRITTKDRTVDLSKPTVPPPDNLSAFTPFLRGTRLIPIDGIVKKTADQITRGTGTDLERARAIYDWIVDNTFYDPETRGSGLGDIRAVLESGNLGGKCADLNALFVGLSRAAGIPARDVYGLRIAPSQLNARCLGLSSDDATRAQHCRAEAYLVGLGWVPVDPADVRKVVLEEPPGHLPLTDSKVQDARRRLFGSWEMNWVAFNYAHDVALPGSKGGPIGYFMYPQAETGNRRVDSLDPDGFRYGIRVRETTAEPLR